MHTTLASYAYYSSIYCCTLVSILYAYSRVLVTRVEYVGILLRAYAYY